MSHKMDSVNLGMVGKITAIERAGGERKRGPRSDPNHILPHDTLGCGGVFLDRGGRFRVSGISDTHGGMYVVWFFEQEGRGG